MKKGKAKVKAKTGKRGTPRTTVPMLTMTQAAKRAGISATTLRKWLSSDKRLAAAVTKRGATLLFPPAALKMVATISHRGSGTISPGRATMPKPAPKAKAAAKATPRRPSGVAVAMPPPHVAATHATSGSRPHSGSRSPFRRSQDRVERAPSAPRAARGLSDAIVKPLVEQAAALLFRDIRVRSVGVTRADGQMRLYVVRNALVPVPLGAAPETLQFQGVPIVYSDAPAEVAPLVEVPLAQAIPAAADAIPERDAHNSLCSGLQIQNFDDDERSGTIARGNMSVGTLGCFVSLADGRQAMISNNHVLGGHNDGRAGDRVLQPGAGAFEDGLHVANLASFVPLRWSPAGASPTDAAGVEYNEVDAAVAELRTAVRGQGFLPARQLRSIARVTAPTPQQRVFKVGRTTGLTYGTISSIGSIVGPMRYRGGIAWFRRSFTVLGENGTAFGGPGDSGSAIVTPTGAIVGLLYSGNGRDTYGCPMDEVLGQLPGNCTLLTS